MIYANPFKKYKHIVFLVFLFSFGCASGPAEKEGSDHRGKERETTFSQSLAPSTEETPASTVEAPSSGTGETFSSRAEGTSPDTDAVFPTEEKETEPEELETPWNGGQSSASSDPQPGVVQQMADFWIGVPERSGSMVYLRLAKGTEVEVLSIVEGYFRVMHRGLIGYIEKNIVDINKKTELADSTPHSPTGDELSSGAYAEGESPGSRSESGERIAEVEISTPCTGGISEELFPGVTCVQYREKVLEKVGSLENYIKRIIDKSEPNREKSIDLACRLFVNEQARVYTSSVNNTQRYRPIRKYLNSLMLLNYDKVEIEWTNIQYVSELRKGPDGKYFGYVHIEQQFVGYIDGQVVYGDVTEKKITIVLEAYEIIDARGNSSTRWDVFLSDIGVEQTRNIG